jgi:hypothetical protein
MQHLLTGKELNLANFIVMLDLRGASCLIKNRAGSCGRH